jgi:hypothetical protein
MEDYYQERIDRFERQKNYMVALLLAIVTTAILTAIWGVYKVTFLIGVCALSYMFAKQIVMHYFQGLISNFELVVWFVVGFITFNAISDAIIAMNM